MMYGVKYWVELGCVLDEGDTDGEECSRKVASGRRVASTIRSIVNVRDLQIECARELHETDLVPLLMYGSKKMLRKEIRIILRIRRIDRVTNAHIRELWRVTKGVDARIDEGVLQ